MSDSEEYSNDEDEEVEVEDTNIITVLDSNKSQLPKIDELVNNPFTKVLLERSKYPTRFLAHKILMSRILAITKGSTPLVDYRSLGDFESMKNYDEISKFIYSICIQEIKEGVSPIIVHDEFFDRYRTLDYYNKQALLDILEESNELAHVEV